MVTTREDIVKALYRHLSECERCQPSGAAPVPNAYKCSKGKALAQVYTIR